MDTEIDVLSKRIMGIGQNTQENFSYLEKALVYIHSDPQSALTKSRIVLEKLLQDLFQMIMKKHPERMIGKMLSNKDFTSKIPQRILFRMNAIREMSNLGPHGGSVEAIDAVRVMQNLLDVIEWYNKTHLERPELSIAEEIERQIQILQGFPSSYFENLDKAALEITLAQDMNIDLISESQEAVAFRYAFPQFLDLLYNQQR